MKKVIQEKINITKNLIYTYIQSYIQSYIQAKFMCLGSYFLHVFQHSIMGCAQTLRTCHVYYTRVVSLQACEMGWYTAMFII